MTDDQPTRTTALIFLDTETTGLQPDRHEPWEIGWIAATHEHMDDQPGSWLTVACRYSCFRQLTDAALKAADPAALAIGRFYERYRPEIALTDSQIVSLLAMDCGRLAAAADDGVVHLVGAVPSFDHAMLCSNILGWPGFGQGLWHYHLIDVEVLAAGHLGIRPPYSSSDLTARLGVEVSENDKHTALGDAQWAFDLYRRTYKAHLAVPAETLE